MRVNRRCVRASGSHQLVNPHDRVEASERRGVLELGAHAQRGQLLRLGEARAPRERERHRRQQPARRGRDRALSRVNPTAVPLVLQHAAVQRAQQREHVPHRVRALQSQAHSERPLRRVKQPQRRGAPRLAPARAAVEEHRRRRRVVRDLARGSAVLPMVHAGANDKAALRTHVHVIGVDRRARPSGNRRAAVGSGSGAALIITGLALVVVLLDAKVEADVVDQVGDRCGGSECGGVAGAVFAAVRPGCGIAVVLSTGRPPLEVGNGDGYGCQV
mmetsp:Transcript_14352/g.49914  ORF Transcript_14352/g.49914 Transcript_14352/m.49914 type:complete len:274 (-) Transcript_14352:411-1232(-)